MSPLVLLSAVIVVATNSKAVVSPIPVTASKSTTDAVTIPAPLVEPTEFMVILSSAAVFVPVRIIFPEVVVTREISPAPKAVTLVATVKFPLSLDKVISASPAVGVPSAPVLTVVKLTLPPPD